MTARTPFSERIQRAFEPTGGVIGVVDGLLSLGREEGLRLDWQSGRCHVRTIAARSQESTGLPLPKSVFRAILARMAALCNERAPDSVSPYWGEGELSVATDPPTVFRVTIINTPGEQSLELRGLEHRTVGRRAPGEGIGRGAGPFGGSGGLRSRESKDIGIWVRRPEGAATNQPRATPWDPVGARSPSLVRAVHRRTLVSPFQGSGRVWGVCTQGVALS